MSDDDRDPTLRVRRDLAEIRRLSRALADQALHRPSDRQAPGGDAMFELGPVARASAVADAIAESERWNSDHYGEAAQIDLSHLNDEDVVSLTDLLYWSDGWRERTGSILPRKPTVGGEATWLSSAMDWVVDNATEQDIAAFRHDVSEVRVRLENELLAGVRSERTRVRCLDCPARLVKVYADKAKYDHWRCPNRECERGRYDYDDYRLAKHQTLLDEGTERFIPVPDAIAAVKPRPEHTVRTWIKRLRVRRICDVRTRQVQVYWPDVRDLNEEAKRRKARSRGKTTAV